MIRIDQARYSEAEIQPGLAPHQPNDGVPRSVLIVVLYVLASSLGCTSSDGDAASDAIVEVTDANFQLEVLQVNEPVLVEFWAPWCQPCLEMAPAMEQVAKQFSGRARVARIRIDENQATASTYNVSAPPAVIVFRHGSVVKRRSGKQTSDELVALLKDLLLPREKGESGRLRR